MHHKGVEKGGQAPVPQSPALNTVPGTWEVPNSSCPGGAALGVERSPSLEIIESGGPEVHGN